MSSKIKNGLTLSKIGSEEESTPISKMKRATNAMVKKAIIPAGGLGSRFLPASAAIPKEIFPVFDKPLIYFAIEELKDAGVEEIFLVCSPWKKHFFESFFDLKQRYERLSNDPSKKSVLDKLHFLNDWPKITLVMQNEAKGLAEAIGLCNEHIGNDPFFVLLPDEVFVTESKNPSEQLLSIFQEFNKSVVGIFQIPHNEVSNYGVVKLGSKISEIAFNLEGLVEKPKLSDAPSNFMLPGRYIFTKQFWLAIETELQEIKNLKINQELHITNAMDRMSLDKCLLGGVMKGERFDVGRPEGLLNLSQLIFKGL